MSPLKCLHHRILIVLQHAYHQNIFYNQNKQMIRTMSRTSIFSRYLYYCFLSVLVLSLSFPVSFLLIQKLSLSETKADIDKLFNTNNKKFFGWGFCDIQNYQSSVISQDEGKVLLYIAFSLKTLSTNNDFSHKTTFGSQKKQWKRFNIIIIIILFDLPQKK
jgi:UDP-galactopyranose mutase